MNKFLKLGAIASVVLATSANAAASLTAPTIETADFVIVAGAVILATGVFFGIRKAISLLR